MKANSIDEIREHLAKGGRVKHVKGQATLTMPKEVDYYNLEPEEWQLLPLEEKEPVETPEERKAWIDKTERECPIDFNELWDYAMQRKEPVDHGTINPCPFCGGEAKATVYSGNDAIFCSRCPAMMGGEESVATEEELAKAWNARVDHGTQKGQEERPSRGAWLEFADDGKLVTDIMYDPKDAVMPDSFVWCEEVGIHETEWRKRIRTRLMHGMWPEMSDLMDWWEATTGERIEWGRRCERCDGTGSRGYSSHFNFTRPTTIVMEHPRDTFVAQDDGKFKLQCGVCQGSGYSVRPTWMEEGK